MTAPVTRRATLAGAAVAGVPLLAACGGDSASPSTAASDPSTPTPESATPTPSATPSKPEKPSKTSKPVSGLVAAADVPVGGGTVLADEGVVVTQPTKGDFLGFSSTCTHQGCPVGSVGGGTINCPCHGSAFSIEDGSVTRGPATSPLAAVAVRVEGGQVVRGR